MSADLQATETETDNKLQQPDESRLSITATESQIDDDAPRGGSQRNAEAEEEEEDDDDDEEEEPRLKYAKFTGNLANVYRNGDSTSAFIAAGDKLVMGTHNGNIHVLALPTTQTLRTYRAHQASVTSVSISPVPPPPVTVKAADGSIAALSPPGPSGKTVPPQKPASASGGRSQARSQNAPLTNTPNNQIYIATSSMDGHVCISSLLTPEDVQLRNFARPVNAVALSPEYKSDRTYLSGGLAGNLIQTVGGKAGVTVDANTNRAAAAASGWFSSLGLGNNTGQDRILHSGEGAISSIKWSHSGRWVAWVNEEGIKIMRSHIGLGSEDVEDAWKRIAHAARPNRTIWEEMAAVWKARCEWVDERYLESDDISSTNGDTTSGFVNGDGKGKTSGSTKGKRQLERLVVGWGDMAWILHVRPDYTTTTTPDGLTKRPVGNAETMHMLQFGDCIISGISLYSPSLLAIMAYRTRDDNDKPVNSAKKLPAPKGRQHRKNGLAPQLRLVKLSDGEEVEVDELPMSRYETLSAQDYHIGTMYIPPPLEPKAAQDQQKGMLGGMFDATGARYATRIFSSSASVLSGGSGGRDVNGRNHSFTSARQASANDVTASPEIRRRPVESHPYMLEPGLKIFIQSPYDCILSLKQDLSDHLRWLLAHDQYEQAWHLIDSHPEVVGTTSAEEASISSQATSPSRATGTRQSGTLADFFADDTDSQGAGGTASRAHGSAAQREKQRIGDLWLQQLVLAKHWGDAGRIAGKILGTSNRWEHWVWTFAQAGKFDEITPYIPSTTLTPPLPSLVYELVLGHYILHDPTRVGRLLKDWDPELFDVQTIIRAIEDRLDTGDVAEDSVQDGVQGRDWRILLDALTKLYLAGGYVREALKCCIQLQDADKAFALIREQNLLDAVVEDVPGLILLRIDRQKLADTPLDDLEASSSEAVQLLVNEAYRSAASSQIVIQQLRDKGEAFEPFLFFYLRALWNGNSDTPRRGALRPRFDYHIEEGRALVDEHADLAVRVFARYDRGILHTFLRESSVYSFDRAREICEERGYIPELVDILSKTGETSRALFLIIDELDDVKQAIEFANEHTDLWDDLLNYSMGKPTFIRGLLEEVGAGAAVDPIEVVRRIPIGQEIPGLKDGIQKLVREFEIQLSISAGVAKVLDGEVDLGMRTLRAGRRKGVRFDVLHESSEDVDLVVRDVPTVPSDGEALPVSKRKVEVEMKEKPKPGHCVCCYKAFHEHEKETLIGFACGHVYHLSCLLKANPETQDSGAANQLLQQFETSSSPGEDDDYVAGRPTLGGKVANAHSIKNVLRGGCQHCVIPEGA